MKLKTSDYVFALSMSVFSALIICVGVILIKGNYDDNEKRCKENVALVGNYKPIYRNGSCLFIKDGELKEIK